MNQTPSENSIGSMGKLATEGSSRIAYSILKATSSAGKTFLLSPSLGDIRQEYRYLAPMLHMDGQHTVITADLRGMGDSDTTFLSYLPEDTGSDLVKLMTNLNMPKYVLVGCSMTAASAVFAASQLPGRVEGVIMLSAFAWEHPFPFGMRTLLSLILNTWTGPSVWADYYKSLYTLREDKKSVVPDLDAYASQLHSHLSSSKRIRALRGHIFSSKDECSKLCHVLTDKNIPVFSVYGEKDPDFPAGVNKEVDDMKKYFPHISGSQILEGCGHYPHVEKPDEVFSAVISFLSM